MADEGQTEAAAENAAEEGTAEDAAENAAEEQAAAAVPHAAIEDVEIELTVVLGKSVMPVEHLLRMGRGAIIELETMVEDDVWVLVNNRIIARGQVMISGERLAIAITEKVKPTDYTA